MRILLCGSERTYLPIADPLRARAPGNPQPGRGTPVRRIRRAPRPGRPRRSGAVDFEIDAVDLAADDTQSIPDVHPGRYWRNRS